MTALDMIRAVAVAMPERVAIEDAGGVGVTYGELIARAEAAARGMARGSIVEVAAERSVAFVVGCLAAWIAGAAWMPVDPREPAWRRDAMRAALVGVGDGLAYVIATSGSSGAPKLVMVGHAGVPVLLRAQIAAFELGPGARSLWLHAPRFDASLSDWGTALASGATLVLPRPDVLAAPARLRDELVRRAITYVDLPPALLAHVPPEDPPAGLRVVVLGGEPAPIVPLRALARQVKVVIVYGPTEATVCSSLVVVDPARWSRPLIGDPLPGVAYRVVDGELWIGGACLALGYAGDPATTARQFVERDGARWYRTGDRVEPCDGGLAFVGRIDRQRKLAGVRVELDEIEAVLGRAPGVRAAAAAVRTLGGRPRLIAFVDGEVAPAALRGWLAREAPPWMMPARVVVGALPRTATGKVDHAALVSCPLPSGAARQASGDPAGARLAALWCDVLGVAAVTGERFRDLGGDSLAQLSLQAGAAAQGLVLSASVFAADPTFDELLAAVRGGQASELTVAACEARGLTALASRGGGMSLTSAQASAPTLVARDAAVLLTGATGQLGKALLAVWRDRPVLALVRAADRDAARRRLATLGPHVDVVCGDVARGDFGLDAERYRELAARTSMIVHAAAQIDLGAGWDAHAPANVDGTAEVARFAAAHALPWHHISTLSVFVSTDRQAGTHGEGHVPAADAIAYGGYAQTKIAAEAIARAAGASTIVRLGLLVGGAPRTGDQLAMTVRGLAKLGAVPAGADALRFDVTPLDYAAAAVDALVRRAGTAPEAHRAASAPVDRSSSRRATGVPSAVDAAASLVQAARVEPAVHHVAGATGARFADLVAALRTTVALEEIPQEAWAARARDRLGDPDIAMTYLSLGRAFGDVSHPHDLFLATGADFEVARTAALLAERGIAMPPPQAALTALIAAALQEPP